MPLHTKSKTTIQMMRTMEDSKHILFIHGAGSNTVVYNHLRMWLPAHTPYFLNYDVEEKVENILGRASEELKGKPVTVIGHSYGGLLGFLFATKKKLVEKLVTVGTPWQGVPMSDLLKLTAHSRVFDNTETTSKFIQFINSRTFTKPHLNVICAGKGHVAAVPGGAPNDGTVPHYSQLQVPKGVSKCTQIKIPNNHSDTLHTMNLVSAVLSFVFEDDLRLATYKDKLNEYSNRPY